ncbi:hypothetical protein VTK73DRAFT_8845 [Phialemonium thermophilum]|uniref:Phospholipase/carboxylesterase/thioesterase domain-containing protein n=1 Tax=Phialemonium thermophilum TaxID=223376 RepID=A0ABR3XNA2_9PEZI
MPPTRIPTAQDFASLSDVLTVSLVFPDPPESTTAIMLLFHGLGDSEAPFASFARNLRLPGVLAIAVRGTSPLAPGLLGFDDLSDGRGPRNFHWGDDLAMAPGAGGELDPDPGFEKAERLIFDRLLGEVLSEGCGWDLEDVLLFGFGQGGSLALGLASKARVGKRVEEVTTDGDNDHPTTRPQRGRAFKGVVSIGGPLPHSMVPSVTGVREKVRTPVLVCCGSGSGSAVDEDAVELIREEFESVRVVRWKKPDDGMPKNREEALPLMEYFAERLRA